MNTRIKQIRNDRKLTQQAFADKLGVSRNSIARFEMGDLSPSDRTIKDICREFSVNEEWLRTGEGNMKIELSRNQEIQQFINSIAIDDEKFKSDFISALCKLSPEGWKALEKFIDDFIEAHKKE